VRAAARCSAFEELPRIKETGRIDKHIGDFQELLSKTDEFHQIFRNH
jgi:hypothetical protein